jgi:hypothetical protein
MLLVTVIQGTFDVAVHTHRSCVALPHVFGTLCWITSKVPDPPEDAKLIELRLTAYVQPAWDTRMFWPAVGVGHRTMMIPSRGAS